jgi:hypothetical protein
MQCHRSFEGELLRTEDVAQLHGLLRSTIGTQLHVRSVTSGWCHLLRLLRGEASSAIVDEVMAILQAQTRDRGAEWEGRNLSMALHAMARLRSQDTVMLQQLADHLAQPSVAQTMNAQGVANAAWAFAKLGVIHEALMETLAHRCVCVLNPTGEVQRCTAIGQHSNPPSTSHRPR